jgi:hypothetical protein
LADEQILIRYGENGVGTPDQQQAAREVTKILTPNEEILYLALQNATALSIKKDAAIATNNRVIFHYAHILGRADFVDFLWQDVANTSIQQGVLSSEFRVAATDGRQAVMGGLDKDQARHLYSHCQQMEQEWREKRRVREMEEARARSGGIYLGQQSAPEATASSEDAVARLAKAKAMLDQGLISEIEYESLKAKILASM